MGLMTAAVCVVSPFAIPIPVSPVPLTLATLIIYISVYILGMNMASLVCGSFIIESVFGWPGVGSFAMEAIGKRDYPVIMAYIMLSGFILVVGNFVADILYSFADPRIKRGIDIANGK